MNVDLGIAGLGAVSPAGVGVEALLQTRELAPEPTPAFGSGRVFPVFRVNQKHLAPWQTEPRLRRASPIALYMVEAARQALGASQAGTPVPPGAVVGQASVPVWVLPPKLGIVAAYGTGAVAPTRRFYEGLIKNGPRFASPNLFPETVFNSPTSHVAAVLGANGPCYSLAADETAWVHAISVAATWLATGTCENVLVIGAEEFDPIQLDAYAAVRWLRRDGRHVPSEGAGAMWLRRAQAGDRKRITGIVEGFAYRNKREARLAAQNCIPAGGGEAYRSAARNWFAGIEREVLQSRPAPPPLPYLGEAFAASAAWNTARAVSQARGPMLQPVWGLAQQCCALLLEAE
jgi:3-oxoacyl-(acyl-carrier-protein) synthase